MAETFLDPQKEQFLSSYVDPTSPTFANARQSALKAGYSEDYANNILTVMPEWLQNGLLENVGRLNMLKDAENALSEALKYSTLDETGKVDSSLARVKTDAAKFVAKTLGKGMYSERKEVTGAGGGAIKIEQKEAIEKALDDI